MSDKSGIDMLEEILQKMDLLSKKIDVLDQNVKKIANTSKVSDLINKASEVGIDGWKKPKASIKEAEPPKTNETPKGIRFKVEHTDASKIKKVAADKLTVVKGKMIILNANQPTPLPDISVKVYDGSNKLIKETKTNRAGVYQFSLPIGKYVAEFSGKYKNNDLVPQNKVFEVKDGVSELELK